MRIIREKSRKFPRADSSSGNSSGIRENISPAFFICVRPFYFFYRSLLPHDKYRAAVFSSFIPARKYFREYFRKRGRDKEGVAAKLLQDERCENCLVPPQTRDGEGERRNMWFNNIRECRSPIIIASAVNSVSGPCGFLITSTAVIFRSHF